jgi:DNA-binding response OmpR family regulator
MPAQSFAQALILNVDDNEGARYAKSRILVRAGFRVIEAADGKSALAMAREHTPELILLDVKLPDVNGMEVCRQLKADPDTRPVLVLQTSASYIGTSDKIRALEGGADNYLFEPIEPEELVANVTALLRLGRVERELRDVARRKDEFLATLAHELRNPLGPIRSAVELLCKLDPEVPPRQDNARKTILRHTGHLVRLVDDLLDVARISHGKITLHRERVELRTFIQSACELVAHIAEGRQQQLRVHLPEQPV